MRSNCPWHRAPRLLALVLFLTQTCLAQRKIPETEKFLFDAANHERGQRKLPLLKWDEGLARAARKHAELMAEQDLLEHRLPGEPDLPTRAHESGANFSHITENIGMAASADKFHDGWMHSPGHRANILDANSDSVGIAVIEGSEELYAVEDFSRAVVVLSMEEQEQVHHSLRNTRPLAIAGNRRKGNPIPPLQICCRGSLPAERSVWIYAIPHCCAAVLTFRAA